MHDPGKESLAPLGVVLSSPAQADSSSQLQVHLLWGFEAPSHRKCAHLTSSARVRLSPWPSRAEQLLMGAGPEVRTPHPGVPAL